MIRLSVPDWCFFGKADLPAADYYGRLREIGIDAVEMVDPARRAAARAAGLEVLNHAGPGMQEGLNRREHHAALVPAITEAIREAARDRIPQLIVFSGNRGGQKDAEGIGHCAEALRKLLPEAKKAGVLLTFEMLNSFDHADYQADRVAYGVAVAQALGGEVKVLYDIYHVAKMGENILDTLLPNLGLVSHIHIAETPTRTLPLATGGLDWRTFVREARQAGYQGHWGLEFVPQGDALDEIRRAADLFRSF